jgi:hypothetical protein
MTTELHLQAVAAGFVRTQHQGCSLNSSARVCALDAMKPVLLEHWNGSY